MQTNEITQTQNPGRTKRVIFNSGKEKITIEEGPDYVVLRLWEFPLWPYGNYVCDEIRFTRRDGKWFVIAETIRDSWYGTGASKWWAEPIPVDESVVDTLKSVQTPEDFRKLAELLKSKVEEMEERIDELLDSIIEALDDYALNARIAEWLKTEDAKKEILQYVYEIFVEE